jgi:hypothetical protein
MTRDPDKPLFRFDAPGTLERPGPLGRMIRLLVGGFLLWNFYLFLTLVGPEHLDNTTVLIWFVATGWLVPYVVNIGWGVQWGMWPRIALIALWAVAGLVGLVIQGELASPPLWFVLKWSSLYVMGHLGVSFFLSGIIATPGCEMRAIPHLLGLASGRARAEHYCPGFVDTVDRWERSLLSKIRGANTK